MLLLRKTRRSSPRKPRRASSSTLPSYSVSKGIGDFIILGTVCTGYVFAV
jgi:hypothetical protein